MPKPVKRNIKNPVKPLAQGPVLKKQAKSPLRFLWWMVLISLACVFFYQFKSSEKKDPGNPVFSIKDWFEARYQKKLEDYLKEHSNLGKKLTPLKNQIDFDLFQKINVKGFTLGKDNYIFSTAYIDASLGRDKIDDKLIEEKIRKAKVLQDTLKKKGIDIVYVYAPGKGTFYPEYLPSKYQRLPKLKTNYEEYIRQSEKYDLNFIDFQAWFLKIKDISKHPLFPQFGHHWSFYGECIAADSLIGYIEKLHNCMLPHIFWLDVEYPSEPRVRDGDIIKKAKLLHEPKSIPMAYPQVRYAGNPGARPIKVTGIGDSYYRGFLYIGVNDYVFDRGAYWYYYNTVEPATIPEKEVWEIDLKENIEKSEVIIVLNSDGNLPRMGSGFIEEAYLLYTNPEQYQKYNERKKKISIFKKKIRYDDDLMNETVKMATELNITEDSARTLKALEMINNKK